jgi:hypothetical protein
MKKLYQINFYNLWNPNSRSICKRFVKFSSIFLQKKINSLHKRVIKTDHLYGKGMNQILEWDQTLKSALTYLGQKISSNIEDLNQ